jgi:exopolysaccharide production protein ExoZ
MAASGTQAENEGAAPAPRRTIYVVQVLRGLAALAVTFYHAHLILAKPEYGGIEAFAGVAGYGWLGVNFFFVLSGFIILMAHAGDIGVPRRARHYATRRFVRVYPVYWIFTAVYVAAALAGLGRPDSPATVTNILASATLVPFDPAPLPPLQVAWTLFYEVFFYALFLVLILSRRLGLALIALWGVAILFYGLVLGRSEMNPLNMWSMYFIVGMGAFLAYRRMPVRWGWPFLLAGGALLAGAIATGQVPGRIVAAQHQPPLLLGLAIVFAILLAGATLIEKARPFAVPASLLLLGDASYSLYLVHSPVLSVFGAVQGRAGFALPEPFLFLLASAIALVAGIAAHLLVEKPLLRALHMRVGRLRPSAVDT